MLPLFWRSFSLCSSKHNTGYRRYYSIQPRDKVSFILFRVFSNTFPPQKISTEGIWLNQKKVPKGYWKVKENQLQYMNWLSNKLNILKMDDWYNVTYEVNESH